jgi:hypothetical protein
LETPTTAFWSNAANLFKLAGDIGEALERSEVTEEIRTRVRVLADGIPPTPEPLDAMDPHLRSMLLTGVIHALRAEEDDNRRQLRLAIERVRQALRDVLDERPVWRAGAKDAAMWLRRQGLGAADLAAVLGASETSVRRWANPEDETAPAGESGDRVVVLAKVVNHLRHAMTARGALQWLQRPHPALDDRRPIDELKDPDSYRHIIHLASGMRSFVAT